jgi:hypothetical protein
MAVAGFQKIIRGDQDLDKYAVTIPGYSVPVDAIPEGYYVDTIYIPFKGTTNELDTQYRQVY